MAGPTAGPPEGDLDGAEPLLREAAAELLSELVKFDKVKVNMCSPHLRYADSSPTCTWPRCCATASRRLGDMSYTTRDCVYFLGMPKANEILVVPKAMRFDTEEAICDEARKVRAVGNVGSINVG